MATKLLSFDEARSRLLSAVRRVSNERVSIAEAAGRVLAEDLVSREPLPRFDHSAMDGFAVAAADLIGDPPWTLPVGGESSAGHGPPALAPRTTCRIFTGAPLPARADTVVMQEHVIRTGDSIRIEVRITQGQHVRRAGEDLGRDAVAIRSGTRLSAGALALAAMLDRAELVVARRPLVTILCTGDELRPVGASGDASSIPESNSVSLAVLARQAGASVRLSALVPDEPRATQRAIEDALDATDLLLTVGGVSVGDRDVVRPALERAGVTLDFWRVAIKPGKPLAVGSTGRGHVLGLPGNPASAMVTFALFGMPLLRAMQADERPLGMALRVRLAVSRKRSLDRLELVRATLSLDGDHSVAHAHGNQSSGAATSLACSDGLAFVPPGPDEIEAGSFVHFVRWSDA